MKDLNFHPATDPQLRRVAYALRPSDLDELYQSGLGATALDGLKAARAASLWTSVFEIDGEPGGVFGIAGDEDQTIGYPWGFFTDNIREAPRELLTWSHLFIHQWLEEYDELRGCVYEQHEDAQRYLAHLGFTIHHDRIVNGWRGAHFKEFSQRCVNQH